MKPAELARAQALDDWCQRYGTLPWPGSVLEQPAIPWLRWHAVLALGVSDDAATTSRVPADDPLAGLPMFAL